ncbi:serine protease [Candidatus Methylacidiphilum fumarolicum]|uniref:Serine protease Do n=2 Tax=Candidatus Methylacidiphilum fumarolicum TaxID=591154 RepID=I0JXF6_METFB|nr:trypsin-like peptidase domain-containing protein [Candidatus Methylacidiphilum fumarolicum]MBW6415298.1 trypsin-like peptidase domain-containing protein [Candidatus Methylacidiphilum fumarolicum]TFE72200.1 serine protease [Candidatus Methylacidiphilum fumarolicum]TFE72341.1 serine protease [Candidatus Methylacidiphilum fumarolicum]CAI9086246.1 Serine protease Do [Candidatus Methylacidiphilum fumarolicum]CCG91925.1 Serine protease Do [Methylacidiphilum fumariolicum SolV]
MNFFSFDSQRWSRTLFSFSLYSCLERKQKGKLVLGLCFFFFLTSGWSQNKIPYRAEDEPTVLVVQKVMPAVVNISSERIVQKRVQDPFDLFFGRYYSYKERVKSLGSGVLVSAEGYIITCAHVVERSIERKVQVTLNEKKSAVEGKVLIIDPAVDLALLKIESKTALPFLDIQSSSPTLLGQTVIVLGNPVGYQNSVSKGILSAMDRTIETDEGRIEGLLQTDAAINPGNSGGPIVDISGKFVGISSAKFAGEAIEGIGFAIPAKKVNIFYQEALSEIKNGTPSQKTVTIEQILAKKFGLHVQEMNRELAEAFHVQEGMGLLISDVEPNSPAAKAGIKSGMIVLAIGNRRVDELESYPMLLKDIKSGEGVLMTIMVVRESQGFFLSQTSTVQVFSR